MFRKICTYDIMAKKQRQAQKQEKMNITKKKSFIVREYCNENSDNISKNR
ncbi:hypothetical protein BRE01_03250 [Brevibacillus reuszeri]|uniref:Uncharacterized protein n=1 Tax=Brevibacillus reuszeri TaxID=54915 RepID=A0ABQ0TFA0_9BACL|nr:hypothetical protein BRE01_03250 [Brevibacillus reuszeri]